MRRRAVVFPAGLACLSARGVVPSARACQNWALSRLISFVHPVLELGVGWVLADAADGPAQDLGAAAPDAGGDQGVHGRQVVGPEPRHHGREPLLRFTRAGLFSEVGRVLCAGAEPDGGPDIG